MKWHYVYVVGSSRNPVKIGMAASVARRVETLQTGHPDKLNIYYSEKVLPEYARRIEMEAHKALSSYHRHGEWFNVDANDAISTIQTITDLILMERNEVSKLLKRRLMDLNIYHVVSNQAESAILYYRSLVAQGDNVALLEINKRIIITCGRAALVLFYKNLVEDVCMTPSSHEMAKVAVQADRAIVAAINCLAGMIEPEKIAA